MGGFKIIPVRNARTPARARIDALPPGAPGIGLSATRRWWCGP